MELKGPYVGKALSVRTRIVLTMEDQESQEDHVNLRRNCRTSPLTAKVDSNVKARPRVFASTFTLCVVLLTLASWLSFDTDGVEGLRNGVTETTHGADSHKAGQSETAGGKLLLGPKPRFQVKEVSCQRLFDGGLKETDKAAHYQEKVAEEKSLAQFDLSIGNQNKAPRGSFLIDLAANCTKFRATRQYYTDSSLSAEEDQFPIAFSIWVTESAIMAERLLRAIYRVQNFYCVHVREGSRRSVHRTMAAVSTCFDNVLMTSHGTTPGGLSLPPVETQRLCMQALQNYTWNYFLGVEDGDFPLRTNLELVRILKTYHGANDISGEWVAVSRSGHSDRSNDDTLLPESQVKVSELVRGGLHITASRGFVDFCLYNESAQILWNHFHATGHQQWFFATLQHQPRLGVPGSYSDSKSRVQEQSTIFRVHQDESNYCRGKYVHSRCVLAVRDLPIIYQRKELFVGVFREAYEPLAFCCMEEWYSNRTSRATSAGNSSHYFDISPYQQLVFVSQAQNIPRQP